ncbi:MAG: carbohydrate-binding domain-containing protein [Planctomycetota bacterium]
MKLKPIVALVIVLFGLGVVSSLHAREEVSLNGAWQVQYSADADKPPTGEWTDVDVPSMLTMRKDTPHVWYRRTFSVPDSMRGKHLLLQFTGVKFVSKVWVNGTDVGGHYGGWEPFALDVTEACKPGENELLVRAGDVRSVIDETLDIEKLEKGDQLVELAKDSIMAPIGSRTGDVGIWQDVALVAQNDVFVDDVFIKTSVRKKQIDVDVTLRNLGKTDRPVRLKAHVLDGDAAALTFDEQDVTVPAGGTKTVAISKPWESPKLWSHLSPHLYHLVTAVESDGNELDSLKTRFGFREFWIDGIYFVLNGTRIKFLATAGHPPTTSDIETAKRYYAGMRGANVMAVRLHANLWPTWWFDAADEVGMLVVQESALWCFSRNYALSKPAFWENYRNHLRGMFGRDKNHPCIMFYSLENEILHCGGDYIAETEQNLADVGLFMKQLDPTRPIMYDADGDPKGAADVVNLHYTHEFPEYNMFPDTCYWVDDVHPVPKWLGKEWKWDRKKPLYMGEFMWSPAEVPGPYALFLGDDAYPDFRLGRTRAKAMAWRFQVEAFRQEELAGMCPWTLWESRGFPEDDGIMYPTIRRVYEPNAAFVREYDCRFFGGESVKRTVYLYNDTFANANLTLKWELKKDGQAVDSGEHTFAAAPAQKIDTEVTLKMPEVAERTPLEFVVKVKNGDRLAFEDTHAYWAFPRRKPQITGKGRIAILGGAGVEESVLDEAGVAYTKIADLSQPIEADLLIIGASALDRMKTETDMPTVGDDATAMHRLADFTAKGGAVLVLEQTAYPPGLLPASLAKKGCTIAFQQAFHHPALKRVQDGDFKFWRGDHAVARDAVLKPRIGSFVSLCDASAEGGMVYCPLIEIRNGRGRYFLSQLLIAEKMKTEPMAQILFEDLVNTALTSPPPERKIAVVQETMKLTDDLTTVGASFVDLSGKLADADLSPFPALLVEAEAKEVTSNVARLRDYAEKGGTILLHGATPDGLARLKGLLPEAIQLRPSAALPVVIDQRAPWIDGMSNEDIYWLGKPTGIRYQPIPCTQKIYDFIVTPGLPDDAQCKTIEAETMELGEGEPQRTEEGDVGLFRNGDIVTEIEFPETAEYAFAIRARGTPVENVYPAMALHIDNKVAASVALSGPDWQTVLASVKVEGGRHRVALVFTNDGWDPAKGEDRNLWIDKLMWGRSPEIPGERILRPAALTHTPIGKGGCLIDQVNWHGRTPSLDKAARYLINLLTNLGIAFERRPAGLAIAGGDMQRGDDSAVNRISGKIAYLGGNGSVFANVKFVKARNYVFEVEVQGTEAEGEFPIVRLLLDDRKVGEQQIQRAGWSILRYEAEVPAGEHKVTLEFTNDLWRPPEDRNLQIGQLVIR